MTAVDLSQLSMEELFRIETENQTQLLTTGLLALERNPTAAEQLEVCMRAAHSLKGAARIVDIDTGVALAHAMEGFFVAAQEGRITLGRDKIDLLLDGVDLMLAITRAPQLGADHPDSAGRSDVDAFIARLTQVLANPGKANESVPEPIPAPTPVTAAAPAVAPPLPTAPAAAEAAESSEPADRVLRVTVDNLNRLLGLAGETLIESRWLKPFGESLLKLKRLHWQSAKALEQFREAVAGESLNERAQTAMAEAHRRILECQQFLSERIERLDASDRRSSILAHRLYQQALACRMRPFGDGAVAFPRMVRDIGRTLGKRVRLDITGPETQVDRDILEKLDAPLGHLLRNAIDHGIEMPDERRAVGKPEEGVVCLEAHHSAGALQIIVSDDGKGIDLDRLRATVVKRRLASEETAARLSDAELFEFLFLPGFTMKEVVTEISGRGVGLDVVQDMLKQVRGTVRISAQPNGGTRFQMQLPLTLSVVRTILVEIGGEPYAFPLAHIQRAVKLTSADIAVLAGRQYFNFEGQQIGLITARQVLGLSDAGYPDDDFAVIVLGDQHSRFGVIVDRFLGGRELVVQPLDPRLGKIEGLSAAALMEDGTPVLIIDVEDLVRSMEKISHPNRVGKDVQQESGSRKRKRILIVEDSLTVRELERKVLDNNGYEVEVAVDGMDGWNAVRASRFDLVITDVDMPRMDGIELVTLIKKEQSLKGLPVMILSYKDREEDRLRGLNAGADYYLTKGRFDDETLIDAVVDLIGEAVG